MTDETPVGRFAVPDALLRTAEDRRAGQLGDTARTVPPRQPPRGARSAAPARASAEAESAVSLVGALRASGWSRLALLGTAGALTMTVPAGIALEATDIRRALHFGEAGIAALVVGTAVVAMVVAPVCGRLADRRGAVPVAAGATALAAGASLLVSVAPSLAVLVVAVVAVGVAASAIGSAHVAALADHYPDAARGRILGWHGLAAARAVAAGIWLVNVLDSATGSWRWGFTAPLVAAAAGAGLWRSARADRAAHPPAGAHGSGGAAEPFRPPVGMASTAQRLRRLRSLVALLVTSGTLGFAVVGGVIEGDLSLQHHWHQTYAQRGHVGLLVAAGALVGFPVAGWALDRAERAAVSVLKVVAAGLAAFGALGALSAYAPDLWVVEVAGAGAVAALAVATVGLRLAVLDVAPVPARATALGLFDLYGVILGGLGVTAVVTALGQANDERLALAVAGASAVAGAVVVYLGADAWSADVRTAAAEAAEDSRTDRAGAGPGRRTPSALRVSGVDFAYGARQVLFDVNVDVAEGEVAALLGTNGAGKSTLLRLVAGLAHPDAGTIRLRGHDTTFLEAEQLSGLGLAMLPGGRMSFPGLTVAENLRVGGHTLRRDGPRLRAAIDEAMAMFPVLRERRDQRVGTLSGGEQQMLALARVLLTQPRLLLIDELSLGLAPKAVEALLTIVRRVNDAGATVVLVEQSVNLALTLAPHALFLERGEVRFDGATTDLLARDDLLRPIFLGAS
jgi:ABC-type branched-subunit amino acid transport system ATPase component